MQSLKQSNKLLHWPNLFPKLTKTTQHQSFRAVTPCQNTNHSSDPPSFACKPHACQSLIILSQTRIFMPNQPVRQYERVRKISDAYRFESSVLSWKYSSRYPDMLERNLQDRSKHALLVSPIFPIQGQMSPSIIVSATTKSGRSV